MEDLVVEGDRAYLVTQYSMRITSPEGTLTDLNGRTFLVYRKGVDGMWRVWRDMDNSAPDVALKIGD
jgi:ketosteroid isomerase-like protein